MRLINVFGESQWVYWRLAIVIWVGMMILGYTETTTDNLSQSLKSKKPSPEAQVFHISALKTQPYVKYQDPCVFFLQMMERHRAISLR